MNNPLRNVVCQNITVTENPEYRCLGDNWSADMCDESGIPNAAIEYDSNGFAVLTNPLGNFTKLNTNAYVTIATDYDGLNVPVVAVKVKQVVSDTTIILDSDLSGILGSLIPSGVSYPKYRYIKVTSSSEPSPYIQGIQIPLYSPFEVQHDGLIAPIVVATIYNVQILTIE